jgi:xanthine dehydrogenase accessory factor
MAETMKLDILRELNRARHERRAAIVVTDTASGEERLVRGEAVAKDPLAAELQKRLLSARSGMHEDGRTFFTVQVPPPRLVVIGAVHISQALAPMARLAGFDVTIIDPRTAFATPERFTAVTLHADWPEEILKTEPIDAFTAVAALTHDPKIDDLPILAALKAHAFYIGALGSRKTHGKRVERLIAQGAASADTERIHAPIGIDIGSQSPAEIAVAILAEIIAALRRGRQAERIAA